MTRPARHLLLLLCLTGCSGKVAVESRTAEIQYPFESDHFVADVTVSVFPDGTHYLAVRPQNDRPGFIWRAEKALPLDAPPTDKPYQVWSQAERVLLVERMRHMPVQEIKPVPAERSLLVNGGAK